MFWVYLLLVFFSCNNILRRLIWCVYYCLHISLRHCKYFKSNMCPLFLVFKLKKIHTMNTTMTTTMNTTASTPTTINTLPMTMSASTTSTAASIGGKVLIVLSIIQIVAFHIYEMKKLSP